MSEEELKKGCGEEIIDKVNCGDRLGTYATLWLCPNCKAKLEGFQKGKLEQKKEELEFLEKIYKMSNIDFKVEGLIYQIIEQLQKEIGGEEKE